MGTAQHGAGGIDAIRRDMSQLPQSTIPLLGQTALKKASAAASGAPVCVRCFDPGGFPVCALGVRRTRSLGAVR